MVAFTLKHRQSADFKGFLTKLMPWASEVEIQEPSGAALVRIVLKYLIDRIPQGNKDLLVQEAQRQLSPK